MSKKLTYEYVKSEIEKNGYELLSEEYKGIHLKLDIRCDKGHVYGCSFNTFIKHNCPYCHGNIKHTYEHVKSFIEKEGYTLLSTGYNRALEKLKMICDNGHYYESNFNNFQRGKRCLCNNNKIKHTNDSIKKYVEQFGYELLSKNYRNDTTYIEVKCDKNHIYKVRRSHFYNGVRCPFCRIWKMEKELKEYVTLLGYNFIHNDRTQIINSLTGHYLELDLWFPDKMKAIEFNGNHWHSKSKAVVKDVIKKQQCKEKDIELLVIWEDEWTKNKDKCKEIIRNFLLC